MYKYKIIGTLILLAATLSFWSCGSGKDVATAKSGRYERPPLKEVSEQQLKTDGRLIDALALQESGREAEALASYSSLVLDDPSCAAAWYEMGRLLLTRGWTDSAETCARRAVDLQGSNTWYLLSLAQVQARRGNTQALVQTWERIVKQNPEVLDYYYELSNAYIELPDLAKAVETLNRVERMIGITEPISLQKQKLWAAAGKPDKALKEVEALADAMPREKRYQAILAESHMQQKHYSKAKQYYDRILSADPNDPYIHIQLAEYYKTLGKNAEADSEMVQAFRNPALDSKTKLQVLGQFYTNEEFYTTRKATTFRLMDMAMAGCSDSTEFAAFYGHVLFVQEKYGEAARWFELALTKDSSAYDLWEILLVSLDAAGDTTAHLDSYARRAATLFPMHTLPHFLLARNAILASRYQEALEPLEQTMKWGFSKGYLEAECHALYAEACYRTGQYDKAWKAFDHCLSIKPDEMSTLNNYAYYLAEQGIQLEKALAMSRRTVDAEPDNANNLDTYAWILHLLGRDDEALPYIEKAVKINPSSETLANHLKAIKEKQ